MKKPRNVFAWSEIVVECISVTQTLNGGFAMMKVQSSGKKPTFGETFSIGLKRDHVWPRPGQKFWLVEPLPRKP